MKQLFKKIFGLWILCTLLAACGVSTGPLGADSDGATGDASAESQSLVNPDASSTDDAAPVGDGAIPTGDAAPVGDGAAPRDAFDDAPAVCGGCFLGAACVPSTPMACGLNSACVRCPAPRVPECQEATCEGGACGIRNLPDGTGCTGGVCLRGGCNRCGTNDTACCPAGNRCNPGLTCVAEVGSSFQYCTPCGGLDGACCGGPSVGTVTRVGSTRVVRNPGGTCGATLTCNADGACSCGMLGEACCPGYACREGRCRHDGTCGT